MDDDYGPYGGFGPEDTFGYGYGYQHQGPALAPDPELLSPVTAAQLIVLRDDALAAEHASRAGISVLPSAVES